MVKEDEHFYVFFYTWPCMIILLWFPARYICYLDISVRDKKFYKPSNKYKFNTPKYFLLKNLLNKNNVVQVQLLVSDSDVESYKQIKSDLDVLRQSVEKSELWVYKSKAAEDHSGKKKKDKEEEDEGMTPRKKPPKLSSSDKKGLS